MDKRRGFKRAILKARKLQRFIDPESNLLIAAPSTKHLRVLFIGCTQLDSYESNLTIKFILLDVLKQDKYD